MHKVFAVLAIWAAAAATILSLTSSFENGYFAVVAERIVVRSASVWNVIFVKYRHGTSNEMRDGLFSWCCQSDFLVLVGRAVTVALAVNVLDGRIFENEFIGTALNQSLLADYGIPLLVLPVTIIVLGMHVVRSWVRPVSIIVPWARRIFPFFVRTALVVKPVAAFTRIANGSWLCTLVDAAPITITSV
jgi:hypothetical protein